MPTNIVLRDLANPPLKASSSPIISTRSDLRSGVRSGDFPPEPPEFTLSSTSNSITATITAANDASTYEIRVDSGSEVSGLMISGLTAEQTYAVQVRGINDAGPGDWSDPVNETTDAVGATPALPEANLVVDTFESADFSVPDGPEPAKNLAGFEWYNLTAVSIVRGDGYVVNNGSPINAGPFPDRQWENGPGYTGNHSMRCRYGAGTEMAEVSFRFSEYHTELWFRRWVRVPINFTHGSLNNKWFSIFPTRATYDQPGTTTFQTRPNGSGGANAVYQDGGVTSGEAGSTPYISVPADRGRWMQIVYRLKWASSNTANDGAIQHWRRWEDETDFTLIHSKLNAQLYNTTDSSGMKEGFIFSWANDPYDVDTEFLMDDVEISTQPLVPAGTEGLQ